MKRTAQRHDGHRPGRTCCCGGCGVIALLLLVPAYLAVSPLKPPPPLAPAEAARIDTAIGEKRAVAEKITKDLASGKKTPFRMVVREEEINRLLETDARLQRAMKREGVEQAWVSIADGEVRATALRNGTPTSITVSVSPEVSPDGKLRFNVRGVDVGRLGVPAVEALRKSAEKAVSKLTESSMLPKARFDSITAEDGAITLSGAGR